MSSSRHLLATRIRSELPRIDRETDNVSHAWERAHLSASEDELLVRAAALSLHAFYNGLEKLFEQIARHIDGHLPAGEAWHRDLLLQMASAVPGIRPPLLSLEHAESLQAYLGFRHIVRNIYTENLIPSRIGDLVRLLPRLWPQIRQQLATLADGVED